MPFLLFMCRLLKSPLILAHLAIASKVLIEAKILQRYAMIPAPAARGVEEPPYHEPELYFYHGEFVRKVAAQDFAHGFTSMTNSMSSHPASGKLKGSSCRCEIAMRVGSRFVYPGPA
jgi:hypothetical protein